ncbi:CbrC family protein [Pectobacterium punjabense]|uniref:CbrC family protein n=1 Tax=Pectobacterium punjabense TaxID=2108399 RepID=UPI00311FA22D
MNTPFPHFRYHPNPLSTGSIKVADDVCPCCNQARGYVYTASCYTAHDLPEETFCPWCIADGSVAVRYDMHFADSHPLLCAGVAREIVDEVCERTPGYVSWQQEHWLSCCDDACAFAGDASHEELIALGAGALSAQFTDFSWPLEAWENLVEFYQPGGETALYRFECLHCQKVHYGIDFA